MELSKFIWNKFSDYYRENDSYKDNAGRGILERLMTVCGVELQQELVPKLEGLIDQLDPETAADEYLSEIAYKLGRPPDILGDIDAYRIMLTQIISIYKVKGTIKSYELLFALLGMSVEVQEHFPPENLYDNELTYDGDGFDEYLYDETPCEVGCIEYTLIYDNLPGYTIAPLEPEIKARLISMIEEFIQPIDCKLRSLRYIDEGLSGVWDDSLNWDDTATWIED